MAQLVHDVAPGANIAFHTAFNSELDFAEGIIDLQEAGADVIVDDVIYFAEPMFMDGMVAQAVDIVTERGVPYFSSAGNQARDSYQNAFRGVNRATNPNANTRRFHDFDPGPGVQDPAADRALPQQRVQRRRVHLPVGSAASDGDDLRLGEGRREPRRSRRPQQGRDQ